MHVFIKAVEREEATLKIRGEGARKSGIAFSARVAPLQKQLFELAQAGEFDWSRYRVLSKAWEWWGAFALLAPVVAAVLMILKPTLPGL